MILFSSMVLMEISLYRSKISVGVEIRGKDSSEVLIVLQINGLIPKMSTLLFG